MKPLRLFTLAASLAALSSIASGYYHWTYFASRTGPFNPVRMKFDLNALPDGHTVSFFISDQGPSPVMAGDSFQSIASQVRLAADVWNRVGTSDLRLRFGGIASASTQSSLPGIDVVFDDDMPPGLLAQTRPITPDDISGVANGATFVPILRSRVQLRKDLTLYQQASYQDSFFLTIVHEFGHSIGLQHTLTSGVMSTSVTRATTKARPLAADDVAGVSLLYPAPGYAGTTGTISGTVWRAGTGVNLASVVALSTTGVAISGMTNPDGTYEIDGIPPGNYYVYTHPLPPVQQGEGTPDNIVPPQDASKNPFPAVTGFETQFFPGTHDWTQATLITVAAGHPVGGVNFNVQSRSGPSVYDMVTYGYQGPGGTVPVQAPPLQGQTRSYLAFFAYGTVVNGNRLAAGLNVSVIGGSAQIEPGSLQYWTAGYLLVILSTNTVSADTPVALAVTVANDLYVLPAAFTVIAAPPPSISSVTAGVDAQGNPVATIKGANIGTDTHFLFDGAVAKVVGAGSDGSIQVSAPAASGDHTAAVEALSGGTTSAQALGSAAPPSFDYTVPIVPGIALSHGSAAAGTDVTIEVIGYNTNFDADTVLGFGSSDVFVRHVWVTGPGRLLANISVAPGAPAGITTVTAATALQMVTAPAAFEIQAANPGQMTLRTPILNLTTQLEGVPLGGKAVINTSGLPADLTGWTLLIANQQAGFGVGQNGQILASVPTALSAGPTTVQMISPSGVRLPTVLMQVDPPAPVIARATGPSGASIDATHPVQSGDSVTLVIFGLTDSFNNPPPAASLQVYVGGMQTSVSMANPGQAAGSCTVQFFVPNGLPSASSTPVAVRMDTRVSPAFSIAVENAQQN